MEVLTSLPPKSAQWLESFCEQSNKAMGLSQPKDFDRFCKFVIVAHDQNVDLPVEALAEYLKSHGWSEEHADAVAKRYAAASKLLKMYDQYQQGRLEL